MSNPTAAIRQFIETKLLPNGQHIREDEALFSTGAIDSLGVLELIAFLEKTFKVHIDTQKHELSEFDTVNRVEILLQKLSHAR